MIPSRSRLVALSRAGSSYRDPKSRRGDPYLTLRHADADAGVVGGRTCAVVQAARAFADHLSMSQMVMISTSTTKTIVQTCQLAVGWSERRSLPGMVSLLT